MAYLGPPPSQKLATPTSQYFSGNGSTTAFTLNRPVNVAEDLNVFVNNVAQQPGSGKSYTATGTTLTFDAAPAAGTNNVYVVYRGLAEPTTRLEHPSGQPIAATTGTFSGGVAVTGDLTVDTNTLHVDSTNNRVGIGTTSPTKKVSASIGLNDTDGYVLEYSGEAKAGMLVVPATGEVRMGAINSTGTYFSTFYANNSEAMRLTSTGNLRLNTTSVFASNNEKLTILGGSTSQYDACLTMKSGYATGSTSVNGVYFINNAGGLAGYISWNGSSVSYATSSDYRLKSNVTYDWDATTRLKQLKPARFNFNADADTTVDGFLAHEVQDIVPEAISGNKDKVDDDGNPEYQGIDQSKLTPLLTKALIEAVEKIEQLEARITALETA